MNVHCQKVKSGEKVRCIFRKVLIAQFVFAIFQIFWKGANVGFREVINEQNLVNSPKWGPENKSDKKGRKDIGGEMDVVVPQAKKVKLGEQNSCHQKLEATSGASVHKEDKSKHENMELEEETRGEYFEFKEEPKDEITEVKAETKDENSEVKEEPKDENTEVKKEPKDKHVELEDEVKDAYIPKNEIKEEVKKEMKHNIKKEFDLLSDWNVLVEKEALEDKRDDLKAEDVQEIIAGRKRINFLVFKNLMESGKLKKEDVASMRSARVVKVRLQKQQTDFLEFGNLLRWIVVFCK